MTTATTAVWTPDLLARLEAHAAAAGFDRAGVAAAPASSAPDGERTAERFTAWVDDGRAGEMEYLKRRDDAGELLRRSARVAMPWARSVIVCAFNYNAGGPGSLAPAPADAGWIGRYAWLGKADGGATDYHDELLTRLRTVEAGLILDLLPDLPCQTRCYVDTGPLLERDFAARAGVGWVGKNTCVLNQELGSWLLLAVIVTSLELPEAAATLPAADRCGSCTRCLDACPTDALVAPREMDASRCIAYLTIEKKGHIPLDLREGMGRQIFGCDICQDVCPWNGRSPVVIKPGLGLRRELINPPLGELAAMDAPTFRRQFHGSPLERTRRHRLHRNVAIAMGNSGSQQFVPQLQLWATGEDAILAEAAQWSLEHLAVSSGSGLGLVPSDAGVFADVDVFKDDQAALEVEAE